MPKKALIDKSGTINWSVFETKIKKNPGKYLGEMFAPEEKKKLLASPEFFNKLEDALEIEHFNSDLKYESNKDNDEAV